MGKVKFDERTLPELVSYVRGRRDALTASLDLGASYNGPDPSPTKTAKETAERDTLTSVLQAIRDIESKWSKAALEDALGL